jgi:phospholipase D1/2
MAGDMDRSGALHRRATDANVAHQGHVTADEARWMIGTTRVPDAGGDALAPATGIVQPGRNCWRVERADRFYCVQDAADYFRLVRQALLAAKDTIFILGWDIFPVDLLPASTVCVKPSATTVAPKRETTTVALNPDTTAASDAPTRLDHLLAFIARRRPRLRCYILIWDYAALYTLERDPFLRWKLGWRMPRHVKFGFDDRIPFGGSHHQKIVVIDDHLAFCGGIDLTGHRWDTSEHRIAEPARTSSGKPYGPYHEVQAMTTGPLATALGLLARDRWRAIGEKPLPPLRASAEDLWPCDVEPDLTDVDVAISRTLPESGTHPPIRECESLFRDSIARARRSIYIESQYFTNDALAEALAARLREPDGPEIVIVSPKECHGWLEQNTMGAFRNRVFRRMIAADRHHRLRLVYPAASRAHDVPTFVHSKVMIVDDELVRIGSANFSRRSMGVDSECDLAVEAAGDSRVQAGIRHIRVRLLAEHLALSVDAVAHGIERAGSLRTFIDSREQAERTLARIELPPEPEEAALSDTLREAADPDQPILSGSLVADVVSPVNAIADGRPHPLTLVANFVLFSPSWLAIAAGAWFGARRGAASALLASVVVAAIGYAAGRWIGPAGLPRWMTRRAYRSARQLGAQGVSGVLALRLASVASAGSIHLICGASRVPFWTYIAGTVFGLAPLVFALAGFGAQLHHTLTNRTLSNALITIGAAILIVAVAAVTRTLLLTRRFAPFVARHRSQVEFG